MSACEEYPPSLVVAPKRSSWQPPLLWRLPVALACGASQRMLPPDCSESASVNVTATGKMLGAEHGQSGCRVQ
eukprot:51772-Prorocentrum_minimum.AAC.1